MKMKFFLSAALVAGVISAQAAASTATKTNAPVAKVDSEMALFGDPVIAKGKGIEIKRSELDEIVSGAKARAAGEGQQLPQGFEVAMLNQIITIQLLSQRANAADKAAGKQESDTQFTNLVERFGSREAFDRQLKMVGMTEESLRSKAAQEAAAKAALKRELNLSVTDAEVKSYYSNHTSAFEMPERAQARHILLMTIDPSTRAPLSTNSVAAKRKQAEDLLARIKKGEDFATLAKQYSEDPGSKADGGELPKFGRGDMVPEFEAAAFSMKAGQVSDIVQSQFGFHIIKLIDKIPAKKYGLMEPITISPNESRTPAAICKEQLEALQIRDRAPAFVEKLRTEAAVEIIDPVLKAQQAVLEAAAKEAPAAAVPGLKP
jgi:parvulin-like peptidyl-prolyl isomerase